MNRNKSLKRVTALTVATGLLAFVLGGCASYQNFKSAYLEDEEEVSSAIKIGIFEPLSGDYQSQGDLERLGAELAHELYPEVGGRQIELVYSDNKSDINAAAPAARELVDAGAVAVIGCYDSALSIAGGEVFGDTGIPVVTVTNTNHAVTRAYSNYVSISPVKSMQGIAIGEYAKTELQAKTAAIMIESENDYYASLAEYFANTFTAGTESEEAENAETESPVLLTVEYKKGETDFTPALKKIKTSGVEVVFFPSSWGIGASALRQAADLGLTCVFLGTEDWHNAGMLDISKIQDIANMVYSVYYSESVSDNEMSEIFLKAYKAKYGEDSSPDPSVALAFDAYMIIYEALAKVGTPEYTTLVDAVRYTVDYHGASGDITFDNVGDPYKQIAIETIKDGNFVAAAVSEENSEQTAE